MLWSKFENPQIPFPFRSRKLVKDLIKFEYSVPSKLSVSSLRTNKCKNNMEQLTPLCHHCQSIRKTDCCGEGIKSKGSGNIWAARVVYIFHGAEIEWVWVMYCSLYLAYLLSLILCAHGEVLTDPALLQFSTYDFVIVGGEWDLLANKSDEGCITDLRTPQPVLLGQS